MSEAYFCGPDCRALCDFCKWYDFNGETVGGFPEVYVGKGFCRKHQESRDPTSACDEFHCGMDTGTEPSTSDTRINPIPAEVCDVIDADYKDGGVW